MAASRNPNMQPKLKLLIPLGWGSFKNKGELLHACVVHTQSVWRDVTGKKNWFLFESHNIQVCFAVSPKKQEILAIQKEKILQKKVLQGWRLLGTPRVIPLKKSVHLYLESSDTSHSHSCHFFLWSTATSALPQSRSGKEFGYTRPAGRSTVTPTTGKKRAFCWSFYFLLQVALKKMVQSAIITLQRSDLQENAF